MKDYEEKIINIMDNAKDNIRTHLDRAYKSGYEDAKSTLVQKAYRDGYADAKSELGKNAINLAHAESDKAYQQGLEDAWKAAKKIHDGQIPYEVFGLDKTGNGFTYASPLNWGENMSASEVISKIKEYEEQQRQDTEIKVWDEVYSEMNDLRFIVTRIITSKHMDITVKRYEGICTDGACYDNLPEDIVKTGRTFTKSLQKDARQKVRNNNENNN